MSKVLRILLTLIATCVLLVLVAIIGLVVFVNPNDLKPQITQAVNKYSGRQIQFNGDIQWSLFPWLGLQLNNAMLGNIPGFGNKPFAVIQKLGLEVRLLPLLHKQLEISKLEVNGLTLNLVKNTEGQTNWQKPHTPDPVHASTKIVSSDLKSLGIVVAGLEIQNGHVFFHDMQKNKHYEISNLHLKSVNLTLNKSSPFALQFNINTDAPKVNARVKINTHVTLKGDGSEVILNKLNINTLLENANYPSGFLPIALQTDVSINLVDQTVTSDKFTLQIAKNAFVGHVQARSIFENPMLSGVLDSSALKAGQFTIQRIQLPFEFKNNLLSLNPITADLYQGNCQANVTLDLRSANPQIVMQTALKQINVQSLFQKFANKNKIQLAGLANITGKFFTNGSDIDSLTKNIHGQGQFSLDKGFVKGINVAYWVAVGKALSKHQPVPTANNLDTPFETFSGTFILDKDVITTQDLNIRSGRLRIDGKGSINVTQQKINYELSAQPILSDGSPESIAIPISISGPLNQLRIVPMLDKLGVNLFEDKLKDKIKKRLDNFDLSKIFH